jgi:small redox-active disulfide protein 2
MMSTSTINPLTTMKKLQILGTGCAKCNALTEATKKAADELGLEYEIVKVTEIKDIMSFGVMMTPALAVDGTVKVMGKVPGHAELKALLGSTN